MKSQSGMLESGCVWALPTPQNLCFCFYHTPSVRALIFKSTSESPLCPCRSVFIVH